jgi:hypothetical protein
LWPNLKIVADKAPKQVFFSESATNRSGWLVVCRKRINVGSRVAWKTFRKHIPAYFGSTQHILYLNACIQYAAGRIPKLKMSSVGAHFFLLLLIDKLEEEKKKKE